MIHRSRSTGVRVAIASDTEREHRPRPGVEQQRLLVVDEELVEREAGRPDLGHERREAVDAARRSRRLGSHVVLLDRVNWFRAGAVTQHAVPGGALGEDADEVDRVDCDVLAVDALDEGAAGGPVSSQRERLAVDPRPLGDDVGDDPAVVVGVEVHRPPVAAARSMRCIQTSWVKPTSNRYARG